MIACHIEQDDSYPCKRYGTYCVPDAIPELVSMILLRNLACSGLDVEAMSGCLAKHQLIGCFSSCFLHCGVELICSER